MGLSNSIQISQLPSHTLRVYQESFAAVVWLEESSYSHMVYYQQKSIEDQPTMAVSRSCSTQAHFNSSIHYSISFYYDPVLCLWHKLLPRFSSKAELVEHIFRFCCYLLRFLWSFLLQFVFVIQWGSYCEDSQLSLPLYPLLKLVRLYLCPKLKSLSFLLHSLVFTSIFWLFSYKLSTCSSEIHFFTHFVLPVNLVDIPLL